MPDLQKRMRLLAGSPVFRIVQYRNRAEELRVVANQVKPDSERETLLLIADTYDGLADHISGRRTF